MLYPPNTLNLKTSDSSSQELSAHAHQASIAASPPLESNQNPQTRTSPELPTKSAETLDPLTPESLPTTNRSDTSLPYPSPPVSSEPYSSISIPSAQRQWRPTPPSPYRLPVSVSETPLISPPDSQLDQGPQLSPPSQVDHAASQCRQPASRVVENGADQELLEAAIDGIGRVYVSMDMDQAGRWRISRPSNSPR